MLNSSYIHGARECRRSIAAWACPSASRQLRRRRLGCALEKSCPEQFHQLVGDFYSRISSAVYSTASNSNNQPSVNALLYQPKQVDQLTKQLAPIKWLLIKNNPVQAHQQLKSVLQQHSSEISLRHIESVINSTMLTLPNNQMIEILGPVLTTESAFPGSVSPTFIGNQKILTKICFLEQRKFCVELILKTILSNSSEPDQIDTTLLLDQIVKFFPEFEHSTQLQAAQIFSASAKMAQKPQNDTDEARGFVGKIWAQILASDPARLDELFDIIGQINAFGQRCHWDCADTYRILARGLKASLVSQTAFSGKETQVVGSFCQRFILNLFLNHDIRFWRRVRQMSSLQVMIGYALKHSSQKDALWIKLLHAAHSNDIERLSKLYDSNKKFGELNDDIFYSLLRLLANDKQSRLHASILADWSAFQRAKTSFKGLESRYFDQLVINKIAAATLQAGVDVLEAIVSSASSAPASPISPLPFARVLVGYCRNGDLRSALKVYNMWLQQPRDTFPLTAELPNMFISLISAAKAVNEIELGIQISRQALEVVGMDLTGDFLLAIARLWSDHDLARLWSEFFKPVEAGMVFFGSESAKNATLTLLIKSFGYAGLGDKVEEIWTSLARGEFVYPDAVSIGVYFAALSNCGKIDRIFEYMHQYTSRGLFGQDAIVFRAFVQALKSQPALPTAELVEWQHKLKSRSDSTIYFRNLSKDELERFLSQMKHWQRLFTEYKSSRAEHSSQPAAQS